MRQIKFRGKRPDNGKWIYGFVFQEGIYSFMLHPEHFKAPECACEVLTETVGQFTGLQDRNNFDIYEGHICKHHWKLYHPIEGSEEVTESAIDEVGTIEYMGDSFGFVRNDRKSSMWGGLDTNNGNKPHGPHNDHWFEIIGNVHDNPELLEEK